MARQLGAKNKNTITAKECIALVAEALGGHERLTAWAKEAPANESVFWSKIYPRMLPVEMSGPDGGPIQVDGFKIEFVNSTVPKPE